MVQRGATYERRPRDLYETPDWVTDAIIPYVPSWASIWEPACASGKMARKLEAIKASDLITDYGEAGIDFLRCNLPKSINAIVTNPPFNRQAEQFIRHGLILLADQPTAFMAMLLPVDFDSGKTRKDMFHDAAPVRFAGKLVLTSRIIWIEKPGASPSTNHAWFFWDKNHVGNPSIYYHFR